MKTYDRIPAPLLERLAVMSEENAEIIHIINKIIRHGYYSKFLNISNKVKLEQEIGDFLGVLRKMIELGDLDEETIEESASKKWERVLKYSHYQEEEIK